MPSYCQRVTVSTRWRGESESSSFVDAMHAPHDRQAREQEEATAHHGIASVYVTRPVYVPADTTFWLR